MMAAPDHGSTCGTTRSIVRASLFAHIERRQKREWKEHSLGGSAVNGRVQSEQECIILFFVIGLAAGARDGV